MSNTQSQTQLTKKGITWFSLQKLQKIGAPRTHNICCCKELCVFQYLHIAKNIIQRIFFELFHSTDAIVKWKIMNNFLNISKRNNIRVFKWRGQIQKKLYIFIERWKHLKMPYFHVYREIIKYFKYNCILSNLLDFYWNGRSGSFWVISKESSEF